MNKLQKFSRQQNKRPQEAAADAVVLRKIQKEAKDAGATLEHGGKGGIDPRIALKLFRKAKWRCTNPDCPAPQEALTLDHSGGHPKELKLAEKQGKLRPERLHKAAQATDPKDDRYLTAICARCHGRAHDRENAINEGKKPPPMPGEK